MAEQTRNGTPPRQMGLMIAEPRDYAHCFIHDVYPFLFATRLKFLADQNRKISEIERQEFENHGISRSQNADVRVIKDGRRVITDERFLFRINLELQDQSQRVSEKLREAFKQNDISFSHNAFASVETRGEEWRITDKTKDMIYTVRKERDKLVLCQL